jgi:Predicted acyltransferase
MLVQQAITAEAMSHCRDIRRLVFIEGQKVPEGEEWDGRDDEAMHFLVDVDGQAAGTCRVRILGHKAKLERMAVLEEYRGHGIGRFMMEHVLERLTLMPEVQKVHLHAQIAAKGFYHHFGFRAEGEHFFEADIEHIKMVRQLP